jgi:uncharacterized protein
VVTDTIQSLLILQDRNSLVSRLKLEIQRLPVEIGKLEEKILEEENSVESTRSEIQSLEVERKKLELDIAAQEEQIVRYKTQQLQVKKNDEYRALTHEIELTEQKISELETAELEVMENIDSRSTTFSDLKKEVTRRVNYQKGLIVECNQKLENLQLQLKDAEAEYLAQAKQMTPEDVASFELLLTQVNREPYITEITGQKCGGCHMRVSNDILIKAKIGEMSRCDQCSRILYVDL